MIGERELVKSVLAVWLDDDDDDDDVINIIKQRAHPSIQCLLIQVLNEDICFSLHCNALAKSMNLSLPTVMQEVLLINRF